MNITTAYTAAVVATGLAGIAVFQMALAFGAPLGRARLGRYSSRTAYPIALRQRRLSGIPVRRRPDPARPRWPLVGRPTRRPLSVGELGHGPIARSELPCQLCLRQPVGALSDGSDRAGSVVAVRSRGIRPRCSIRLHPSHRIASVG